MRRTSPTAVVIVASWLLLAGPCQRGTAETPLFPDQLVDFGPASRDPLFVGGGPQAWDRDIRERGWIMRESGRWHLWYTGSNMDRSPLRRLGYASSPDGLNWVRGNGNPLVQDAWVEDVCIVRRGGCLVMFAEGEQDIAHWLTSTDRLHWRGHGPVDIRLVDGSPIPDGPRGTPTVWCERGTWYLFYERRDAGVWLATSRDLRRFTNVSDSPVLSCGPDPYDRHLIAMNQVVRHAGRYYAYYHASGRPQGGEWSTCIATSDDLEHWVKYAGNPVLPVDRDHPTRSSATLVHDGTRYRLYTTHPDVRVRFSVVPAGQP